MGAQIWLLQIVYWAMLRRLDFRRGSIIATCWSSFSTLIPLQLDPVVNCLDAGRKCCLHALAADFLNIRDRQGNLARSQLLVFLPRFLQTLPSLLHAANAEHFKPSFLHRMIRFEKVP